MITITKDKIFRENHRNEENEVYNDELIFHLREDVILDDVTFERVFDIVVDHQEDYEKLLRTSTGGFPLYHYIDEYKLEDNDDSPNDVTYLELERVVDIMEFEGETDISEYVSFHGIREDKKEDGEIVRTGISLMGVSINNLKKYPLKINNTITYQKFSKENGYETILEGKKYISLFEMFDAIFYELSFHGTPKMRDEFSQSLRDTVERIDSGEEKTYEMLWDDNNDAYFINDDGEKEYFFKRNKNDE